ncbi:IclR family transcriptional regulator [Caballeronia ptereochthonis]|uniref:IclR family transcriptional regulator n=1 Tax=Caballeronia ptereochthonis TaxID=1777144 RepID=A0A157ZEP6_9BURK|nr:IclR family transcriptional regulator [Caballeronia ptereochthonis]SAK43994.1 IclR family transcriptional regulator [Caballeronia ptereochthonis]
MNDEPTEDTGGETADALFNQSLEKGIAVLRSFSAQRRTMSLPELAEAAGITKSSAQRMIYTLEKLGYVRKHPRTKRYQLTPRVMQIGYNYLAADTVIDVANPFLSELTNVAGETCNLTEPDGDEMLYVARFVCMKFVPIHMPIGSRIPMYCTASGRAYLSALPVDEARAIIDASERIAHTQYTETDPGKLEAILEKARRNGYATNREELFLGDMTIAAPVLDGERRPVAAVHVVAPTSRWTLAEAEQRLAPAVIECARSISNSIRTLG